MNHVSERRIKAVREQLTSANVDLAIIYTNAKHTLLEMEPVHYLSGFKALGPHTALFLPKDDEPILLTTPAWDIDRAQKRSWIDNTTATDDFSAEFERIVQSKNWTKARAGLVGMHRTTKAMTALLQSQFEIPPRTCDQAIAKAGRIRDELEMTLVRKAIEIADRAYRHMLEIAKPGMPECELGAELFCYSKTLGAEDNFQMMSAAQQNLGGHLPTDRRLAAGDLIIAEISPSCGGQFGQICRTAVLGPPTNVQQEKYQVLVEAMTAAVKAGAPKVKAKEIVKAMNAPIEKAGYGKYCHPPYMRVRGHGLGLGSMQPGDLTLDSETVLEEGMLFIVHPNQHIPETGYLLCGETVVVTGTGLEILTSRPLGLDSIPV